MRTGAITVHQALTAEAATVLKLSLNLARRRGHAQVTPLHVAATLLTSTSSSSSSSSSSSPSSSSPSSPFSHYTRDTSNLLRRACLKSHPHHPASHPLQCRALELCFNVALNRLPTTPPPSSASLTNSHPSLSNALIAALKRAQAHQRRGCIELQQQQQQIQPSPQQQQQQPLLAIKVELEQLIISILDDPSVSRVMREAGFSSTSVKNNLEEESFVLTQSSPFCFESHSDIISHGSFWQTQFLKVPPEKNQLGLASSLKEDMRVLLEVMLRKQGKRNSIVVVGDSVSITEGLMAELMGRVERGEVPDELRSAHFIKLQFSYVHLRLVNRGDVDMKVSDLRRKVLSLASETSGEENVIIYVGDLRWAVDEDTKDVHGFNPVEHIISEVGRLLSELRSSTSKAWLLATANYQTYMRCQMRQPSLESQWALQAVMVPSGGLALSLQAPSSGLDTRMTRLAQCPFQMFTPKTFSSEEEEERLICCSECSINYEKELSVYRSESKGANNSSTQLPVWLQLHKPDSLHMDNLIELRRKWNRLCQRLHHGQNSPVNPYHSLFNQSLAGKTSTYTSSKTWWSSSLQQNQKQLFVEPHSQSFTETAPKHKNRILSFTNQLESTNWTWQERDAPKHWSSEDILDSIRNPSHQEVKTTLVLGSPLFSDSATSQDKNKKGSIVDMRELERQLKENIPWQSNSIASIMEAFPGCMASEKKGIWLLIQGSDCIAKRRVALVIAQTYCGSTSMLARVNMRKSANRGSSCSEILRRILTKDQKGVILIEDIDQADTKFLHSLVDGLKIGSFLDPVAGELVLSNAIIILTTSGSDKFKDADGNIENVAKMRMRFEETSSSSNDLRRKLQFDSPNKSKKLRAGENGLDLNLCAEEEDEEEEALPSDITHENHCNDGDIPDALVELVTSCFTFDATPNCSRLMSRGILSKLNRAFEDAVGAGSDGGEQKGHLSIDEAVLGKFLGAYGSFLESLFERWVREVFQTCLLTVEKGGKRVRLVLEGIEENLVEFGFQGSVLPNRIHVD